MKKMCKRCNEEKSMDFYVKGPSNDGLHPWCRTCRTEYARESRKKNPVDPQKARSSRLKHLYGLTSEQFDDILGSQGGLCAGCGIPARTTTKNFHVDHDHSCCPGSRSCGNCVRGLLCGQCNTVLGMVNDDTERLASLIKYLNNLAI